MKKIIFTSIICSFTLFAFGQSNTEIPSLLILMKWANLSYSKFDIEARSYGFKFKERKTKDTRTINVYERKFLKDGISHKEQLLFKVDTTDNTSYIEIDVSKDLIALYATEIEANKFISTDCQLKPENSQTSFCYETAKQFLRLIDEKDGVSNSYTAIIYNRKK
jgi:hypothetical protein